MSAPANSNASSPAPAAEPAPKKKPEAPKAQASPKLKLVLLKIIDVTALGFLEPVVRLCYGEEPQVQMQKIGRYIVVPILAMVLFFIAWTAFAPLVKTKSGELPTPAVVWTAFISIMTTHERENAKEAAYLATGTSRESQLESAQEQLARVEIDYAEATKLVEQVQADHKEYLDTYYVPLQEAHEAEKQKVREAQKVRKDELAAMGESLAAGDKAGHDNFIAAVRNDTLKKDQEKEMLKTLEDKADVALSKEFAPLIAAQQQQTAAAESRLFLAKMVEMLGEDNRSEKVSESEAKLAELREEFYAADAAKLSRSAKRIISAEDRLEKTAASSYARPWTFPDQIIRSVFCVFCGFVFASFIAIPIGVLCGLNRTFMAAMTPFIALFKPVSPIVWLPITLIVASGLIGDPEDNWFIQLLWQAPLIDWLKINPAFIASAITVALCSLWATMVNTALGVASVDKDHMNVASVLRLGFWQRLFKIILPSSLPLIFAGMRISLGVGWMVLIAAELLASSEGIGKFVWDQFNNGASDSFAKMMVVVFIVGLIGLILDRIMIIFQRMVSFEGSVAAI
jgi:nitrate/nitrite transport system permease protein